MHYAVVVVVEAPDDEAAYDAVTRATVDLREDSLTRGIGAVEAVFVGDPWQVGYPEGGAEEFDTAAVIDQRREVGA